MTTEPAAVEVGQLWRRRRDGLTYRVVCLPDDEGRVLIQDTLTGQRRTLPVQYLTTKFELVPDA